MKTTPKQYEIIYPISAILRIDVLALSEEEALEMARDLLFHQCEEPFATFHKDMEIEFEPPKVETEPASIRVEDKDPIIDDTNYGIPTDWSWDGC